MMCPSFFLSPKFYKLNKFAYCYKILSHLLVDKKKEKTKDQTYCIYNKREENGENTKS